MWCRVISTPVSVVSGSDGPSESAAAAVLRSVLMAGAIDSRDRPGGPPGEHDFDVWVKDQLVAVEVTRSTKPTARAYASALEQTPWESSELRHTWLLSPTGHPKLNSIRERAIALLRELEERGVTRVEQSLGGFPSETRNTGHVGEAGRAGTHLLALGIDEATCIGAGPGKVLINWPVESTFESPDVLVEAVEAEAPANTSKLGRAGANERHLFVWIDMDNWPAWAGIRSDRVNEARAPALPSGIDVVWAAAFLTLSPPRIVLWRGAQGDSWSSIPVDQATTHQVAKERGFYLNP